MLKLVQFFAKIVGLLNSYKTFYIFLKDLLGVEGSKHEKSNAKEFLRLTKVAYFAETMHYKG